MTPVPTPRPGHEQQGSQTDSAGGGTEALTAHACEVAIINSVTVLGQIELRYASIAVRPGPGSSATRRSISSPGGTRRSWNYWPVAMTRRTPLRAAITVMSSTLMGAIC